MPTKHQRELELFTAALEQTSPADRSRFLKEQCGEDVELRKRLEALLEAHDRAGSFLASTLTASWMASEAGSKTQPVTETAGDRIGRYKIRERIGEGGCGVVYVAEQEEPVRRRVALKIIKLGMDTKSVIARFEAERQALAMMDHPNIAKVLDAGATETGRPYFVMELVRGIRITAYCDQNKLSTGERLDLFIKVCHAVQHAHQKGIIHRDLKPSNILVTLHDGVPVPKIIDFGIAKATEGRLTEQTVYTELHQFIGTPAYMSPEQAEMSGLDIDTRSDIYSLGVLLYELLTGQTPFDAKELAKSGLDAMRKTIREMEPARPSTRLSGMDAALLTTTAARRGSEVPRLVSAIRGDLDWIVMKCLEKDRTRRYESASGLAMDLKRHISSEPVTARPPSTLYRVQKAIRRNRLAFSAAAAVAVALALGAVGSTWQAIRATRAEHEQSRLAAAEAQQRAVAETSEKQALAAKAQAVAARGRAEALAYAADMNLAERELQVNNLAGARQLVELHRPDAAEQTPVPWEWRYLWQQSHDNAPWKMWQSPDLSDLLDFITNSADDHWLLIGSTKSKLTLWELTSSHAMRKVRTIGKDSAGFSGCFAPKGDLLACSDEVPDSNPKQYRIQLWDPAKDAAIKIIPAGSEAIADMRFTDDGENLVILTEGVRWGLKVINIASGKIARTYEGGEKKLFSHRNARSVNLIDHSNKCLVVQDAVYAVDLQTMKELWNSDPHDATVLMAITPDEKHLIIEEGFAQNPEKETAVVVLDAATGQLIGKSSSLPQWLFDVQILPQGNFFVTANSDQTLQMWDMSDLEHVRPTGKSFRGHTGIVVGCTILHDGKTMYSIGQDGAVLGWDLAATQEQSPYKKVNALTNLFGFGRDGKSAFLMDSQGKFWRMEGQDYTQGTLLADTGGKADVYDSDMKRRLVTAREGTFKLWDLATGKLIKQFGAYDGQIGFMSMSDDGTDLIYADIMGRKFHQWNLSDFREMGAWSFFNAGQAVCSSPDHKTMLVISREGQLIIWDRVSDMKRTIEVPTRNAFNINFSRDGKYFALETLGGTVDVFASATLQMVATVGDRRLPLASAEFSPDGRLLLCDDGLSGRLDIWDLRTQREVLSLAHPPTQPGSALNLSPDGKHIALSTETDTYLWKAPTWDEIQSTERAARQ